MPLYNHLKEYRAKINVNQHEMGQLVGQHGRLVEAT